MLNIYRTDINGLRAIAVISVIFNHAKFSGFFGGFVGVDIFFVISGYLISNIILKEIYNGQFQFKNFYERRIRRILPVLTFILFITTIFSIIIVLPEDLRKFGKGLLASVFMIPNVAAWIIITDYFTVSPAKYSLLHLWSLGIEEQFYLFFPVLLLFLIRYTNKKTCFWIIVLICIFSFSLEFWATINNPKFGFYWLPMRAWEFLLGISVAYYQLNFKSTIHLSKITYELLSIMGIFLITFAVTAAKTNDYSLILSYQSSACIGTALIIATGTKYRTVVYNFLSFKTITFIGLISYSLYLWHWPLISLLSYWQDSLVIRGKEYRIFVLLAVCLILSILTWKYIELPFRDRKKLTFAQILKMLFLTQSILICCGVIFSVTKGLPQRYNLNKRSYALAQADIRQSSCFIKSFDINLDSLLQQCQIGKKGGRLQFAIFGDSHSYALVPVFDKLGKQYNITGLQISKGSTPAVRNVYRGKETQQYNRQWQQYNNNILSYLSKNRDITDIFLISRWNALALTGTEYESTLVDEQHEKPVISYAMEHNANKVLYFGLKDMVNHLVAQGKRVWIVGQIPEMDRNIPKWLTKNGDGYTNIWLQGYPERRAAITPILQQVANESGASLLDPSNILCRNNMAECRISADNRSIYSDDNHVTTYGALFLSDMLTPAFEKM